MTSGELLTYARSMFDRATQRAGDFSGNLESGQSWIVDTFGQNGLYAAYVVLAALGLFLLTRLAKMTFSALKYLVVPGVGLALIGSFVLPYSFVMILPVTVVACSLLLLFKG